MAGATGRYVARYPRRPHPALLEAGGAERAVLSTTLNPYLWLINYFSGPTHSDKPVLLDFDALLDASDEAIFYTYLEKVDARKGKCVVRRYEDDAGNPVPSVAVEMEVRFSGSPDRVLAALGKSVAPRSVDDVVSGLSWTGLLDLARQLTGYAVVERWFVEKGVFNVNLNGYVNLRRLVRHRCAIYDNAVEAIRRYDRAVVELMEEVC